MPSSTRRFPGVAALLVAAVVAIFWLAFRLGGPSQEDAAVSGSALTGANTGSVAIDPATGQPEAGAPGADGKGAAKSPAAVSGMAKGKGSATAGFQVQESAGARSPAQRRQQILAALQQAQGRELESRLSAAIRDSDPRVRREALEMMSLLASPELDKTLLPAALQDEDPVLRDLAFHHVNTLPVTQRIEFCTGALHGANEASAREAAQTLAVLGGKPAVNALLAAWPRLENRPRAGDIRRAVQRLTGQDFSNSTAAQAWWSQMAAGLDDDLLPR